MELRCDRRRLGVVSTILAQSSGTTAMLSFLSLAGAAGGGAAWGWAVVLIGGTVRRPGRYWPPITLATVALYGGFDWLGLFTGRFAGTVVFAGGAGAGVLAHLGWLSAIRARE